MADAPLAPSFSFTSQALPRDTFTVLSFEGREGLCELSEFTAELASSRKDLDLDAVMDSAATLTISRGTEKRYIHGVLESFEELHEANGLYFYRATLRPALWRLTLAVSDRVFVNESVPEILEKTLKDGGMTAGSYEFRLRSDYPPRDFVCRYGETLYDFFLRWITRLGLYYFLEQGPDGEKVVITDTSLAHADGAGAKQMEYATVSGLDSARLCETVQDFGVRRVLTPESVTLRDYNYRKPTLDLTTQADAGIKGAGERYLYGEHYRTPEEGHRLAKIRAEELAASALTFTGSSFCPGIAPGYTLGLTRHFEGSLNGSYLAVSVTHEGQATVALASGFGPRDAEGRSGYKNRFTAIKAATQYRPPTADRAAIAGMMEAVVDAAGSGQYAELDEHGRYRVILPFDQSGLTGGKASAPVRMLTPYGGDGFGMHCPLHKGTEAVLGYADGNPDRPILLGAAPNPENKSQIDTSSQTQCRLTTAAGHKLHFEDQEGNQRILMQSKTGDFMRIGAHNDPIDWGEVGNSIVDGLKDYFSEEGISLYAPGNHWMSIKAQNELVVVLGEAMLIVLGFYMETVAVDVYVCVGLNVELDLAFKFEAESIKEAIEGIEMRIHPEREVFQGSGQQVTGAEIRASENTTTTAMSRSEASIEHADVRQEANHLAGQKATATQVAFDGAQDANRLSGERMEAYQDALHLSETRQQLAGQRQVLAQEAVQSTVERTAMLTNQTTTAADKVVVAENKVDTAANTLSFFGIYEKA